MPASLGAWILMVDVFLKRGQNGFQNQMYDDVCPCISWLLLMFQKTCVPQCHCHGTTAMGHPKGSDPPRSFKAGMANVPRPRDGMVPGRHGVPKKISDPMGPMMIII